MESISRHIMPLVINSLGGGHTHMQASAQKKIKKPDAPATGWRAPGLKTINYYYNAIKTKNLLKFPLEAVL